MVGQRKKLKQQFKDLMTVCYAEAKSPRAFNVSTDAPKSFLNKSLARVEPVKNVSMYHQSSNPAGVHANRPTTPLEEAGTLPLFFYFRRDSGRI